MSRFGHFLQDFLRVPQLKVEGFCFDLGSSYTKVSKNKRLVFVQPTCLTLHTPSQTVVEIGDRAFGLLGKTPPHLETIFPIKKGLVASAEHLNVYLQAVVRQVSENQSWITAVRPSSACGVPSIASELDRVTLERVMTESGFGSVRLIKKDEIMAARLKRPDNPESSLCVIDIGGDTTEVIFYSGRRPIVSRTILIGGWTFSQIIRTLLKTEYHCEIGWQTAEKMKYQLSSLVLGTQGKGNTHKMVVRGKDIIHSLPMTVQVSAEVVAAHFENVAQELLAEIQLVLAQVPAELVSISLTNGVFLTGGGSKLAGLGEFLAEHLQTQLIRSATPQEDLVKGLELL